MDELLSHLEHRLKALIDKQRQLEYSNDHLRQGKNTLLAKQDKVISQVQALVTKLKTIEISS
jgi:hypothetical protein